MAFVKPHADPDRATILSGSREVLVGNQPGFMLGDVPSFVVMRVSKQDDGTYAIDYISEGCEAIWGLSRAEIGSDTERLWARVLPEDLPDIRSTMESASARGIEWAGAFRIVTAPGELRWVVGRGLPRPDIVTAEAWSIIVTDVTSQMRAFHDLQASEARFRALSENIPGAIFRYCVKADGTDEITDMSAGCFDIWELTPSQIMNDPAPIWAMVLPEDLPGMQQSVAESARTLTPWYHVWRMKTPDGKLKWLQGRGQPHRTVTGDTVWHSLIFDVTDQRNKDEEIRRLAEEDDLTGLANRAVLATLLSQAITNRAVQGGKGALLLIDIDGFSEINGALGHDGGDQYLRIVGDRLRVLLGQDGRVARLGGDEFALLVPLLHNDGYLDELIQKVHAVFDAETLIETRRLTTTVAIGSAVFPTDGATTQIILKHADLALSDAEAAGGAQWIAFTREIGERRVRRKTLAESLRQAVLNGDLQPALQPIVCTNALHHEGFEALARWTLNGDPVPPIEFIPLAEEAGLGIALGEVMLEKSLDRVGKLKERGLSPGFISVNVCAAQLCDKTFPQYFQDTVAQSAIAPGDIQLEVTENVIFGRSAEVIADTLNQLHEIGAHIALDDFGTGYASLVHLRRIKVDCLKIDQSFIRGIETDSENAVIVRTIVNLAQSLGLSVVAEGIETEDQLKDLQHYGCHYAQGYLIARPTTDIDQVERYLRDAQV